MKLYHGGFQLDGSILPLFWNFICFPSLDNNMFQKKLRNDHHYSDLLGVSQFITMKTQNSVT